MAATGTAMAMRAHLPTILKSMAPPTVRRSDWPAFVANSFSALATRCAKASSIYPAGELLDIVAAGPSSSHVAATRRHAATSWRLAS
jgi:hypothetical protein